MTIKIHDIKDHRRQMIAECEMVTYADPMAEGKRETREGTIGINAESGRLRFSPVKSITGGDYGGFADAGRDITITLEDGHVQKGDSEHGGWNFLKLWVTP